jgi:Domain of unknown function (DUF6431)
VVTVRGSAESVGSRLLAGVLRCPCGGRLGPWGHARPRVIAMARRLEEFWPRRGRCRSCGRTHVLLPADLWSRRRYGAAVIMTVLVLAARAAGGVPARPFAAVPGTGGVRMVPASTARSWRSRFASHAAGLREQLSRLLPGVSGSEAARPAVPSGSRSGDCLAVLGAMTAALAGRFPVVAGVSAHEVAAHLSGGRWLAPPVPVLEFNTSLFHMAVMSPS